MFLGHFLLGNATNQAGRKQVNFTESRRAFEPQTNYTLRFIIIALSLVGISLFLGQLNLFIPPQRMNGN